MVEHAQSKKAKSEKFISVFAKYYTPIVVALALIVMFVPPLFLGDFKTWIYRGLMFLVVSCPCALVVSIPLGFFAGIGCASKNGILVKGSNFIEKLAKLDTVVFDKTGTLTKGVFAVKDVYSVIDKDELIKYAAYAEFYSTHPIAVSVKNAYKNTVDTAKISNYTEISGMGISADIDGHKVLAGNGRLLESNNISHEKAKSHIGSIIYIAVDGKFAGYIVISDEIKADSKAAISALKQLNIKSVMLTGDVKRNADYTAEQIGIDKVYSQLLPQDKVSKLEEILSSKNPKKNVPIATIGGVILAAVCYVLSSSVIMGMIPNHALANSSAPFADAARLAFGEIAGNGVAICAALGCLGSLAGWTLLVGQSAKAAADDGLFGNVFARTNSKGVPSAGLAIVAGIMTIQVLATMSPSASQQFGKIASIAVILTLLPYIYSSISIKVLGYGKLSPKDYNKSCIIGLIAAVYSMAALVTSNGNQTRWSLIFVIATIVFFSGAVTRKHELEELHETPGGFSPRWVRYTSLAITILTLVGTFWYSVGIDKNMELKHRTNITTTTQAPDKVGSTTTQSVSIDN